MTTVSVIIPAYNPGEYLRAAIHSVCQQTFADWELVVIDDNSSEDLSWITREFPQARLIRQAHGGASVARNNGVLNSAGKYVAFMDQDDLWRPPKLERQVRAMEQEPGAAVCYCDLEIIRDEAGQEMPRQSGAVAEVNPIIDHDCSDNASNPQSESAMLRSLRHFSQRFVVPSTVLIRRSALATSGMLDPFIPFSGDYDLLIKLGSRHKAIRIPSADVLYRKHANNFSDQYEVGRREVKALVARYVAYAESKGDRQLAKEAPRLFGRPRRMYTAQAFDRARRSLAQKNYKDLAYHYSRSVWFSPTYSFGSSFKWLWGKLSGRVSQ